MNERAIRGKKDVKTLSAADGVSLAYRIAGDGGRPIYFVHGWMVSGETFHPLLGLLDHEGRRFVVPDLRGSGRSGKPPSGYTIERYVSDLLAIADHERHERFVVVGHSMGGLIAQGIACTQPDRVEGLVLLCTVPASGVRFPPELLPVFRQAARDAGARNEILSRVTRQLSESQRKLLIDSSQGVSADCIEGAFEAWSRGAFESRLGEVRARTLVVASDDPSLPRALLSEAVQARIPGARLAHVPDAGHYVHLERPRETAAVLEGFLAALP